MKKYFKEKCLKSVVSFGVVVSMALSGMVSMIPIKNHAYADSGYNLYFGNLHAHTAYSDGIGTPEEAFKHMRETKAGDFGAITDHSGNLINHIQDKWEVTKALEDKYTDENFVAIAGTEVLLGYETGEMCTFNIPMPTHKVDAPKYYDWLTQNENSIAQFNHPKAYDNEFYEFDGWSEERNKHVKLIEYSNADWDNTYLDSYIKALSKGWKLAPAANSDTHKGKWLSGCDNRTVVLAKSLTRENIFEAIRARRAYATEDKDLRISYTINGEVMGQTLYSPTALEFNVNIQSPSGNAIKKVELYADGKSIKSQSYSTTTADWSFSLTPSYSYYFVKVKMKDGKSAVTAPIWIDKTGTKPTTTTTTPTTSTKPTTTPTTSQTTTSQGLGEKVFAPYVQLSSSNVINVNNVYSKTGQPYYTFAFMNNNNGTPAWRGKYNYDDGRYDDEIAKLRQSGGDIIISFGGANSKEMAPAITDVTKLQQAYQKVIDRFNLKWMDFDIEGSVLKDTSANTRRNKAILGLQKDNPDIVYTYCLPADPEGLSSAAVKLLKDAVQQGVRVDVVNVMAMDYGDSVAPNPEGKMGYYAIQTAKESKKQLEKMGLTNTQIGVTVMIGMNDETSEIFRVSDAKELLEWAKQTDWVRLLSFWSVNRDNGNGSGSKEANDENSSISQSLYEFTNVFKAFNQKGTSATTPTTTTAPTTTTPSTPSTTTNSKNLALNKVATCSSIEEDTDLVAGNAVDGNLNTRWASEEGKSNPEWLQVDLGSTMPINKVDIKWEAAYAKAYQIQVSTDGKNYTTVANVTNNSKTTTSNEFNQVDARYVRVYCTQKATKYGYSIYELEVYNTKGGEQSTPTPSTTPTATTTPTPSTSTKVNTNLALNKVATCSSVEKNTNFVAQNAVDGNSSTRWGSTSGKTDPEWLQVDLGSIMSINKVDIKWEKACAKSFQIQISTDGTNFKTVSSTTGNRKTTTSNEFDTIDARYVRVYCTKRATKYGYSIYELEVYNTGKAKVTPNKDNLALNKVATCSSVEKNTNFIAENAVDGSQGTRWGSVGGQTNPEWLQVDLGSTMSINEVDIKWETAYAKAYQVQVSTDGTNYTTVANVTGNTKTTTSHVFEKVDARYVRIYCTEKATKYGYSIYEVEVYNKNSTQPSTTTSPSTTTKPTTTTSPSTTTKPTTTTSPSTTTKPTTQTPVNGANVPFPQSLSYSGVIKPNNVTQNEMNESIKKFYDYWKKTYVKESSGKTSGGGYYVGMKGTGGDGNEITTSEAHGYGMLIFAYMAGYDKDAKTYFDGMFNMYDKHRSTENNANMSWVIDKSESTSKDSDSATDGDLDIAYALLLADKQWGSDGKINYLEQAKNIINKGIKGGDVDKTSYRVKLGDWQSDKYNTRASDWMTDHFSAYQKATGDTFWTNVNDTIYSLIDTITKNYATNTGLMPDFIVGSNPKPASANFLEADTDGDYSWNSCRYPWRISLDYIINGNQKSKAAATKVSDWIISSSKGDVTKIYSGYTLNGSKLESYQESAFTAPFIVAATVNSKNQDFVNKGWTKISNWKSGYYGDSINLLCQLVISGNYWAP